MDKKLLTRIIVTAVLLFAAWMVTKSLMMPIGLNSLFTLCLTCSSLMM
jgi:hypothetical protein